jgi:hypothetical protein
MKGTAHITKNPDWINFVANIIYQWIVINLSVVILLLIKFQVSVGFQTMNCSIGVTVSNGMIAACPASVIITGPGLEDILHSIVYTSGGEPPL